MLIPASITITCPVIDDVFIINITASAISSGSTILFRSVCFSINYSSGMFRTFIRLSPIFVLTTPGAIALTLILGASSRAKALVMAIMPPLQRYILRDHI